MRQLDLDLIGRIKRLAVLAMVSDDDLMNTFIFKGGSAIDMIYDVSGRASLDLDFSMEEGLTEGEETEISQKIEAALKTTFKEDGLVVHDVKFEKRPSSLPEEVKDFWGGYQVIFKVIPADVAESLGNDKDAIIRESLPVGKKGTTKFKIDISSYEYIASKRTDDFEDHTIYVYSPEMIVFEKLRAICQQIPEYKDVVKSFTPKARGRDFYDIELLMSEYDIDPTTKENKELIENIFKIKKAPLGYIKRIVEYREFHRENFEASLKDTVTKEDDLKNFDYYFDYVWDKFKGIEFKNS